MFNCSDALHSKKYNSRLNSVKYSNYITVQYIISIQKNFAHTKVVTY